MTAAGYETIIGLEVHTQLATDSKMFCGCSTKFGATANTQVCPVCLGLPGVLPVVNRKAVNLAIRAGLALECSIAGMMKFDRKHYYYPDLPKNFQISQYDLPLASGGKIEVFSGGKGKIIRIRRVHLEEDAGKLVHAGQDEESLVDFNRTGIPLLEIVSEPDISSPQEAYDYLTELKAILRYLEVSDCNMEEGSLRCDANVSVRFRGTKALGVKAELKNMNTFKGVRNALEYEAERQIELLEAGGSVVQETRLWDEAKARTYPMRAKEEAFDYRYFPEPDLVPFILTGELLESIEGSLPELPRERFNRFKRDFKISPAIASVLVNEKELADYFEEAVRLYEDAEKVANWLTGDIMGEANKRGLTIRELGLEPAALAELLKLIDDGVITGKIAKAVLPEMIESKRRPRTIVDEKGLSQIKSKDEILKVLERVIAANPRPVDDYRSGKVNALTFLVGQVMKATRGKANPKLANELLKERMKRL